MLQLDCQKKAVCVQNGISCNSGLWREIWDKDFSYKKVDEPTGIKRYRGEIQDRGIPQERKISRKRGVETGSEK